VKTQMDWSVTHRILFRFALLYWTLAFYPPTLLSVLPWGAEQISSVLSWPMDHLVIWTGVHVFHLTGIAATMHPTGSGDTALAYVSIVCDFTLAVAGAAVWSVLDRRRGQYRVLDAWLRLLLSFTLAATLFSYGFAKIYPGQFLPPGLRTLTETYGESSPMGLLWTFMGASRWYTLFGGLAEVAPGLLLCFRRTRTLGALLAAAVLTNIVALNLFYDVPVKQYSAHLLLLAIFLAGPDLVALGRLFLLRGQAQLRTDHVPATERLWLRRTGLGLQGLFIVCAAWTIGYKSYAPYPVSETHVALYGVWVVEHPMCTFKTSAWQRFYVQGAHEFRVSAEGDGWMRFTGDVDAAHQTITLTNKGEGDAHLRYVVDPADARHLTVSGTWSKGGVGFELRRINPDSFLLQTRGFHWVSEDPFNR
jgi:hypothetical protein